MKDLPMIHRSIALFMSLLALAACGGEENGSASSGSGSSASASGSSSATGTGGAGGEGAACAEVTLGAFILSDTEPGGSSLAYDLSGLPGAEDDALYIEFFDTAGAQAAGSFDVSKAPDDNYSTCAHCILAYEDINTAAPVAYFQESGTLKVTSPDAAYMGASAGSFDAIKLVEVTLEGTKTTPVQGGKCLSLSGAWDHKP